MASPSSSSLPVLNITARIGGVLIFLLVVLASSSVAAAGFKCNNRGATCNGLVGYVSPNSTTLSHIMTMFGVPTLHSLLGANNLSLSTPLSYEITVNQTVKIPFECHCSNGTGIPLHHLPIYTVAKDDGLWHIAAQVFSGLVTYQQIQEANNITNVNLIEVGQKLWIPLPCSCDQVDGQRVVHYGHVVQSGSTLEEIAHQYNTTENTLLELNGLPSPKALLADTPLDVPLKACTSMVEDNSSDYPLLIGDGTYAFTAEDCVMCKCDTATNNWTLQCEPSSLSPSSLSTSQVTVDSSSSMWKTCPSMQCQGRNLYIGSTSFSSSCNGTTCSYAGYINQTILTTLSSHSICTVTDKSSAQKVSMQSWSWSYILVSIHLMVLCLRVVQ